MADDEENNTTAPDRSSRDLWLNSILGPVGEAAKPAPQAKDDTPATPASRAFKHQLLFKSDFRVPQRATLTGVEVREVPEQVYAVSAEMQQAGTWTFVCDHLDSVSFYADDTDGLRQSTAVVAKFMLSRNEDGRNWSEIEASQLILVKNETDELETSSTPEKTPSAERDSCVASMIDLDISIDNEDIDEKGNTSILLSGLAPGAILNAGHTNESGVWSVPQSDLKDLAIIVPDKTPPFDLSISLGIDEEQASTASIGVDVPNEHQIEGENMLMLRFSASSEKSPHRIRVFADGREIYDRVMLWGNDPDIPLDIVIGLPNTDDLPFELLIREEPIFRDITQSATLLAAEFNDHLVRLDDDLIRGNFTKTNAGVSWQGDLIISARDLGKSIETPKSVKTQQTADEAIAETSPINEEPLTSTSSINQIPPSKDDDTTLIIQASSSDIQRSGFIEELCALQSFVRTHAGSDQDVVYERLGLTIKNWGDIRVIGPTKAEVELNPELINLAPKGGRDNVLQVRAFDRNSHLLTSYDFVEIRGLPTGCLVTRGKNLGNGRWLIPSKDILNASAISLVSSTPASIARVFGSNFGTDDHDDAQDFVDEILIGGGSSHLSPNTDLITQISIPLDSDTFDPEGHGALSLTVGDVPPGILLIQGTNHGDGVWTHETRAKDHLSFQIIVPRRAFTVSITCVAMNNETSESTVITHRARVRPDRMEVVLDQAVNA